MNDDYAQGSIVLYTFTFVFTLIFFFLFVFPLLNEQMNLLKNDTFNNTDIFKTVGDTMGSLFPIFLIIGTGLILIFIVMPSISYKRNEWIDDYPSKEEDDEKDIDNETVDAEEIKVEQTKTEHDISHWDIFKK